MDFAGLDALLADKKRTQRERLGILVNEWSATFAAMEDAVLLGALRLIRRTINSKKLKSDVNALIGANRRDGQGGEAPLPKPPAPATDAVEKESAEVLPDPEDPHRAEFASMIARDPRARASYLVVRDWLEGNGFVADGRVTLGPLSDCEDMLLDLDWHLGFIRSCRVAYNMPRFNNERSNVQIEQVLEWLLDVPGPGRFVRELTVGLIRHDDNRYDDVCKVIGARTRPALETLFLGDFGYEECELNWSTIGDASPLWPALPNLRTLTLRSGSMKLGAINLPELRSISTISGGMGNDAASSIANAKWPKLERMSLQFGPQVQGGASDIDLLQPILAGVGLENLKHLGITNCDFTAELCLQLTDAPILRQLETLDLSMGTMGTESVRHFIANRPLFTGLKRLDVDDNYLAPNDQALLLELGPEIVFGEQRSDDGGATERYASAFE